MKKAFLLIFAMLTFITTHVNANYYSSPTINQAKILEHAPTLDPTALKYAVKGYFWAYHRNKVKNPSVLTVIDFNLPSNAKRVWVIDLKNSTVLLNTYTTQGKNSGDYYARHFSNRFRSDETSLGVYETLNPYYGKHGLSLRLAGLEKGINDHAYDRAIVVHPAWYASPSFVTKFNRTGRSWGCFAINPAISRKFVDLTKNGSILFAFATPILHDHHIA